MLSLFVALAQFGGVVIGGSAQCPTATQVSERLHDLMPKASSRSDRATLEERDGELHIELHGADGSVVGRRTLAARGSCSERAEAVAVTIAAWEGDLDGGNVPPRLLPPRIETPFRAPEPSIEWEFGAGFLASVAGGSFAAGGTVDLSIAKRPGHFSLRLGANASDSRDIAVGRGQVSWNRVAFMLGPAYALTTSSRVRMDLHGDLVLGWLFAAGHGFSMSYGDDAFDPAVRGGIRGALAGRGLLPWLDVSVVGWLRNQGVSVGESGGVVMTTDLPRIDLWITCGFAVATAP